MQFITVASLFAAAALAAPAAIPQDVPAYVETVTVTKFFLRKNTETGTIDSVDFKLSGDDATDISCAISAPTLPSETITCGDNSPYRFILTKSTDATREVELSIYHQTGQASGIWNAAPAPALYCHAGGNGAGDFVCQQIEEKVTYELHQ
jgi:hypothetical protein